MGFFLQSRRISKSIFGLSFIIFLSAELWAANDELPPGGRLLNSRIVTAETVPEFPGERGRADNPRRRDGTSGQSIQRGHWNVSTRYFSTTLLLMPGLIRYD